MKASPPIAALEAGIPESSFLMMNIHMQKETSGKPESSKFDSVRSSLIPDSGCGSGGRCWDSTPFSGAEKENGGEDGAIFEEAWGRFAESSRWQVMSKVRFCAKIGLASQVESGVSREWWITAGAGGRSVTPTFTHYAA